MMAKSFARNQQGCVPGSPRCGPDGRSGPASRRRNRRPALAAHTAGGEANLVLPDLSRVTFLGGIDGHTLLLSGLVVCALGLLFGLVIYRQLEEHAGASSRCSRSPS